MHTTDITPAAATRPASFTEFPGALDYFPAIEVRGSELRAGMVIVDDLGCPVFGLDTRRRARHGSPVFLAWDLEGGNFAPGTGRLNELTIAPARLYPIAAR